MRKQLAALAIIVALGQGVASAVPTVNPAEQPRIASLIEQLGSVNFRERDAATKELDALGETALVALRKAAKSSDMEVVSRSLTLIARIEQRIENARLIAPTYLELTCKDTPVEEAVAELAKKSSCPIVIAGNKARLAGRKVSFATGQVPFWKAFEMLCEKAELVEASPTDVASATGVQQQPAMRRSVYVRSQPPLNQTITLVDGKASGALAHVEGAVRIRTVRGAGYETPLGAVPEDEIRIVLDVKAEAKIQLLQVLGVKVDRAIDDRDQTLVQSLTTNDAIGAQEELQLQLRQLQLQGAMKVGQTAGAQSVAPARLKKGATESTSLKELRGTVSLKIRTPVETLVTVDNILKARGETVKGRSSGAQIKVINVQEEKNGDINVEVELEQSHEIAGLANGAIGQGVIIQGNVQIQIGGAATKTAGGSNLGIDLLDAKGAALKFLSARQTRMQWQPTGRIMVATFTFHADKDQHADKLVFRGSRPALVDVPFVLKDVPLK
jgi:hypothetical protein